MYIIFEMKDQRTLGPIQIIGRYQEFGIGYIPDTHTDIINWHHIGATVIEESVAKAYMLADGWNGKVSVRKATQQNEILQVVASTEDDYTKVKYELTDEDKVNAVKFMQVVLRKKLDKVYDSRFDKLNLPPNKLEGDSWAQQKAEAQAFKANGSASCPLLNTLAVARGITLSEMADKVLDAIDAHNTQVSDLLGKKQTVEKEIKEATTIQDMYLVYHKRFGINAPFPMLEELGESPDPTYNL